jgi:hypothetical protein
MNEQDNVYSLYEAGVHELLSRIGPKHRLYSNALVYQERLHENIKQSRSQGTDALQAERRRIINELNKLAVCVLGTSLSELCAQIKLAEEQGPTDSSSNIIDPLLSAKPGPEGPVHQLLENVINARPCADCETLLRLCREAVECARKHGDQTELALACLYQAEAEARNNQLETGVKLAERARQVFEMQGDHHNAMVAQLLLARLRVARDLGGARVQYLKALDCCQKLESHKKECAQSEEALLYRQITQEIQRVLRVLSRMIEEAHTAGYVSSSIPILQLSEGPDAICASSQVIDYVASGEFRVEGHTYILYPLNQTVRHTLELENRAVYFALRVPEDGWLDPASKQGDYALVQRETRVTQEGPAVLWTKDEWVAGRFERDTEGNIRFFPQPARIIGSQKVEPRTAVALLKRAPPRSP